ncbi:hypothetical protein [Sphingobacterium corticibacter]|uniref:Uncharacterized protein n=1 Tax=Sphingobacterium corticibacter TaxID=2171749 RepID=A0A2T8HI94_9SPHI|nr:hypothetical protein [Sphingobacterium corticibacter]PVH25159.1 hypothetical protein DC487_09525 [Sphingobacterium corticibacter]
MKGLIYILGFISTISLVGCSKDYPVAKVGGDMMLRIDVAGITESTVVANYANARAATNTTFSNISRTSTISMGDDKGGFYVDHVMSQTSVGTIVESVLPTSEILSFSDRSATISPAAIPMQNGYRYRIFLYNKNNGQLWRTLQGTAGTPLSMEGQKGETYLWYAYSYNDSEALPEPSNINDPSIETSINRDFLYASGEITIASNLQEDYILGITFERKVAQVHIKIDGTVLARFATINNLNAAFDRNDYLKKGRFSVRSNQMNTIDVVPTEIIFNNPSPDNTWERTYYTVDPASISKYNVVINDLPVKFDEVREEISQRNLATYYGAANKPTFTTEFENAAIGQRLSSVLNLNYQVSPLRILHISSGASYGYALERGPAWDFLNASENFGDLPESVIKMGSWSPGQGSWAGGNRTQNADENRMVYAATTAFDNRLAERLAATNTNNRPDIVIIGYDMTNIRPSVARSLNNYLNSNGVVIMMLQNATSNDTHSFFNTMFGVSNIGTVSSGSAGAMYPIEGNNPTDKILNGPFGDVRGRYWGEDAGTTLGLTNLPPSQITIYSYGNAINRSSVTPRVTMFKHNTKNFFFIGDGGFVSYNGGRSFVICPFNYNTVLKRPLPKAYGNAGSGYSAGSRDAYNSVVIANIMAWAVEKAELQGIRQWRYAGPPTP